MKMFRVVTGIKGKGVEVRAVTRGNSYLICSSNYGVVKPEHRTCGWLENALQNVYEEGRKDMQKEIRKALGVKNEI